MSSITIPPVSEQPLNFAELSEEEKFANFGQVPQNTQCPHCQHAVSKEIVNWDLIPPKSRWSRKNSIKPTIKIYYLIQKIFV